MMKLDHHMENLEKKVKHLQEQLNEYYRHHDEDAHIVFMKKQKLAIKDQMAAILKKLESVKIE